MRLSYCLFLCIVSVPSLAQIADLKARDKAYKHGRIEYTRRESDGLPAVREELVFTSDGRYRHTLKNPRAYAPGALSVSFVKGKGWAYSERVEPGFTTVTFKNPSTGWPRNDNPLDFITEKPSHPLVAGLSKLKKLRETGTTVTGIAATGEKVEILYSKSGMPKRLSRLFKSGKPATWEFKGQIWAGAGPPLPQEITLTSSPLAIGTARVFRIKSADFSKEPDAKDLTTDWFKPGITVEDNRVTPTAFWNYADLLKANGNKTTLTPEELLVLSSYQVSPGTDPYGAAKIQQTTDRTTLVMGIVLGLLALLAAFALVRMYLRDRRMPEEA